MMTDYLFILIVSFIVFVLDVHRTWPNMDVPWNGYGSVENTLAGKSKQPMQYRVLVPWLCGLLGKTAGAYLTVKMAGVVLALSFSYLYFSAVGAPPLVSISLLSLFFILAAIYDYADTYWEVGLVMAAFWLMLVHPIGWLVIFITILATLNRETGGIIPLGAALMGMWWESLALALAFGVGFAIPRLVYGKVERYTNGSTIGLGDGAKSHIEGTGCSLIMFRQNLLNFKAMLELGQRGWFLAVNEYTQFLVLFVAVTGAAFFVAEPLEVSALILFYALIVPTVWREIRVFAVPVALLMPVWLGL